MENDSKYVSIFTKPIRVCASYRPVFGTSNKDGLSYPAFAEMYSRDPLYSWIGLNSKEVYAAHKAAGGITSFYRQLGIGCERLVREILCDLFSLTDEQASWSYTYTNDAGKVARLSLDARIDSRHVASSHQRRLLNWVQKAGQLCGLPSSKINTLSGCVIEVRQGYKSADAKRQNADLRNAIRAYNENYLPIIMILSNQINNTVGHRYSVAQIHILSGKMTGNDQECTYAFFKNVVGFDLEAFFRRNEAAIQTQIHGILKKLVEA